MLCSNPGKGNSCCCFQCSEPKVETILPKMWKPPGLDFTLGSKCHLSIRQFHSLQSFHFTTRLTKNLRERAELSLFHWRPSRGLCFLLMCILREFEVGVWNPQWGQVNPSETSCLASMCLLMSDSFAVLYSQLYSQWYRPSSHRWCWPEKSSFK